MFDPHDLNALPEEQIAWFDDLGSGDRGYAFLSNFWEGEPIRLPGVTWEALFEGMPSRRLNSIVKFYFDGMPTGPIDFKTGEHAFAAMKAWNSNSKQFLAMALADDPNEAKALGRSCQLRPDWEIIKLDLMMAIQRAKYTLDREEGQRLLETGDALLIEGTLWGDDVWGVDLREDNPLNTSVAEGANWLGTMIMARRAELRAQRAFGVMTRAFEKNAKTAVDGWQKPAWMK